MHFTSPLPCEVQSNIKTQCLCLMLWTPLSSSVIGIESMPIRLKFSYLLLSLSMHSQSLGSEVILCTPFPRTTRFINRVPIRTPLSISSYPNRRYNEDPEERMTISTRCSDAEK